MKARACTRKKFIVIFLFLAVAALIFGLRNMEVLEQFQHKVNYPLASIYIPKVSTDTGMNNSFCTFQPLSPEDALEERLLLDSIAWPETPPLPAPVSLENTSDPAHSTFTILPRRGGGQWQVGDQLEVMIEMSDFHGRPKKSGGDLLLARLHNMKLVAGVAGQVVDHLNGSYSAVFSLPWEGDAQVKVLLVHPNEAITVLKRINKEQPDRVFFKSLFRSGSLSEITICDICLRPTQQPLCNFTDRHTGDPWFCYKPENLSCNARINHFTGGVKYIVEGNERKLFQRGVNLRVEIRASGPASVTVLPKRKDQPQLKSSIVTSGPSGYYYQGAWRSLNGPTVRQFNITDISPCLKGKVVHMYGDSTVRQFFEYLNAVLPDLKVFNMHSPKRAGPYMALDYANNIRVTYRFHGPPIRIVTVPTRELRHIANEIDGITGGTDTVVIFGIWAHFGPYPMEVYIRRLQSIRRAVVQLLDRAPDTVVIIRTGNPQGLTLNFAQTKSDWFSLQFNKVLRLMFKDLNVHLIDAWEMVLAHYLSHMLHPQLPIIKNMMNVILSYVCPAEGN